MIQNLVTGKVYIGQTINYLTRVQKHKRDLETNKHHSILLQRAYIKYGADSFEYSILENNITDKNLTNSLEQYYIDTHDAANPEFGYNVAKLAIGSRPAPRLYEAFGKHKTLKQWANEYGLNPKTLDHRVNSKTRRTMSMEQALTKKLNSHTI